MVSQTRGSAIAERPAQRSVSVKILVYCYTNNANKSRVSLSLEEHFQQLPRFIQLHALFCIHIVALGITIEQRACSAVRVINRLPYTVQPILFDVKL